MMASVRPIPPSLLPHTMEVRVPAAGAARGGEYMPPRRVGNVRYQAVLGTRPTAYQLQDGTTGIVFADAETSPGAFEVPAGSKLAILAPDGWTASVSVLACRRFEDVGGRVHHWELEVR